MAMYIVENIGAGQYAKQFEHCRHIPNLGSFGNIEPSDIVEIQADGHELEHILTNIKGIRTAPNKRVVRWFGDEARFILANL